MTNIYDEVFNHAICAKCGLVGTVSELIRHCEQQGDLDYPSGIHEWRDMTTQDKTCCDIPDCKAEPYQICHFDGELNYTLCAGHAGALQFIADCEKRPLRIQELVNSRSNA